MVTVLALSNHEEVTDKEKERKKEYFVLQRKKQKEKARGSYSVQSTIVKWLRTVAKPTYNTSCCVL